MAGLNLFTNSNTLSIDLTPQKIGSTNGGTAHQTFNRHEREKRDLGQLGHIVENIDNMASKIEDMSSSLSKFEIKLRKKKWRKGKVPGNREEGRSMKEDEDNETKFRQQGLEDINWGMTIFANGLKFVSALLTVLGGDSTIDRNDGYDEAVSSLFTFSGSILRFVSNYLLTSSNQPAAVEKLGIAADTQLETNLTPAEILQKKKVEEFVSNLSPEEIEKQQQLVLQHVQQEAFNKGLTEAQAQLLLAQTLAHNSLPQLVVPGSQDSPAAAAAAVAAAPVRAVQGIFSGAGDLLNSVLGSSASSSSSSGSTQGSFSTNSETEQAIPGLPTPGTLEHTITLALYNANQNFNQFINSLSGNGINGQPAADNKIGQAAVDTAVAEGPGILGAVSVLPQTITAAANQVAQFFVSSPADLSSGSPGGSTATTYSQVKSGINPTYAALGLLTTGALGTVAYSLATNMDSDLATSATSLAQGALSAMKRNDIVETASKVIGSITGNTIKFEDTDDDTEELNYNYYDTDYGHGQGYMDYGYPQGYGGSGNRYKDPRIEAYVKNYPDYEYEDPRERLISNVDPYQTIFGTAARDTEDAADRTPEETGSSAAAYSRLEEEENLVKLPNGIPKNIEFYEPEKKDPEVPFVTYSEEYNPWVLLNSGQSTEHLYRQFY